MIMPAEGYETPRIELRHDQRVDARHIGAMLAKQLRNVDGAEDSRDVQFALLSVVVSEAAAELERDTPTESAPPSTGADH